MAKSFSKTQVLKNVDFNDTIKAINIIEETIFFNFFQYLILTSNILIPI